MHHVQVAESAPKIVTFTIPLDKVGEVIGPKGKVINTIQQETGAEINVSDDGATGIITIGSPDNAKVEDARSRILAIVDPPTADLGATYTGRVVNIAQFGAFVNILPGRDGLVHISKLGNGQRIAKVEDVLEHRRRSSGSCRRHRRPRQGEPFAHRPRRRANEGFRKRPSRRRRSWPTPRAWRWT
jgi:polyribonucleotide nucleotidyltransferase